MISLPQIAASVVAAGSIGGGALALDRLHVSSETFDKYIEQQIANDERDWIIELKKTIREIQYALYTRPGDEFLTESLAEVIDELCAVKPDDRLCHED
jgi:hypothetical protein